MRILVVSTLYPPVSVGGYEIECFSVVKRLAERHEMLVLTSASATAIHDEPDTTTRGVEIWRELALLTPDERGALRAPLASLRAARTARRALEWKPDLIYAWNGSAIPHSALRVMADSGVPLAFRVCEHWFEGLFLRDQFLRELIPAHHGPAHAVWAGGCRALNLMPALRLRPTAPLRAAISWNSEAMRRMIQPPPFVQMVLERMDHAVPPHGDLYAESPRLPVAAPEIVFVGRVTPNKGVAVAIEALALLRSQHQVSAKLAIIGPDDRGHSRELQALAEQLGVHEQLQWRGALEPQEVAQALSSASAMIVPSTWDEPLGLVVIEGALARVPLVASDVGGIGEAMSNEEHALLFPRGDAAAAAAALARTLHETAQTAARVRRAFERAQSFRLNPYLDSQERFVHDAFETLTGSPSPH